MAGQEALAAMRVPVAGAWIATAVAVNTDVIRMLRRGQGAAGTGPAWAALAAHPLRLAIGVLLTAFGTWLLAAGLLQQSLAFWSALAPPVRGAWIGGATAAAATAFGSLPILFARGTAARQIGPTLVFSAGVMLAASVFSLLVPAHAAAVAQVGSRLEALWIVAAAAASGAAALLGLEVLCRRQQRSTGGAASGAPHHGAWLFVLAIVLHNVPEGLSIGVGYACGDMPRAHALAGAIAIQDLPEGLVVALAVRAIGWSRRGALAAGMASGLVELPAAVVGAWLIGTSTALLPWALAAAAGAMLFAIWHELVPMLRERQLRGREATVLLAGFALMALLDNLLG